MRVFVLNPGRSASLSFARACGHISNYTVGHETRSGLGGAARLDYPDNHIEVDNRLSWFLGSLDRRFDPEETFFVHLLRDEEEVAQSFVRRWKYAWRGGVIEAFAHALIMRRDDYPDEDKLAICRTYVTTVNDNIRLFLRDKPHTFDFRVEAAEAHFADFWRRIGAEGSLDEGRAEWATRHNQSR